MYESSLELFETGIFLCPGYALLLAYHMVSVGTVKFLKFFADCSITQTQRKLVKSEERKVLIENKCLVM